MSLNHDYLGFAAAICTTCAFVPQVVMVWRQKGAPGISTGMYLMFITGVALWLAYGLSIGSWPVLIANAVTLVLATSVLAMKTWFERAEKSSSL